MPTSYPANWRTAVIILGLVGLGTMLFPFGTYRENTLWCGALILVLAGCVLVTTSGSPRTKGPSPVLLVNSTILIGSFLIGSLAANFSSRVSMGPLMVLFALPILLFTQAGALIVGTGIVLGILFFIGQQNPRVALGARAITVIISLIMAAYIYQAITQSGVGNSY